MRGKGCIKCWALSGACNWCSIGLQEEIYFVCQTEPELERRRARLLRPGTPHELVSTRRRASRVARTDQASLLRPRHSRSQTRREAGGGSAVEGSAVMETALAAAKLGAAEQLAQALDAKAEAANARDAEGAQAARRGTHWRGHGPGRGAPLRATSVTRFFAACAPGALRVCRRRQPPSRLSTPLQQHWGPALLFASVSTVSRLDILGCATRLLLGSPWVTAGLQRWGSGLWSWGPGREQACARAPGRQRCPPGQLQCAAFWCASRVVISALAAVSGPPN